MNREGGLTKGTLCKGNYTVNQFVFFPQILVMEVEDSVNLDGVGLFNSVFPV